MKLNKQYEIKRRALDLSIEAFAAIAGVDAGTYITWMTGGKVERWQHFKIKDGIENYIRSLPREQYLRTRIIEETLTLGEEDPSEHVKTLAHLMIHVSKLQMMYVCNKEES